MPIAYGGLIKADWNSQTTATATLAVTQAIPAGSLVVVGVADGSVSSTFACTDSKGNTYTQHPSGVGSIPALGNGDVTGAVFYDVLDTALENGDTITITFAVSSFRNWAAIAVYYTGLEKDSRLILDETSFGSDVSFPETTSLDSGTSTATDTANEVAVGFHVANRASETFTNTSGYTSRSTIGDTTELTVYLEDKIVSATGTQQSAPTMSSAAYWLSWLMTFRELTPVRNAGKAFQENAFQGGGAIGFQLGMNRLLPIGVSPIDGDFPLQSSALLDDFNRSNEDPISTPWDAAVNVRSGDTNIRLTSNRLTTGTSGATRYSGVLAATFGDDQEAKVTLAAVATDGTIVLRLSNPESGGSEAGYGVYVASQSAERIQGASSFGLTPLWTADNITFAVGDEVGARIVGNVITQWRKPSGGSWSCIGVWVDSTVTSGSRIGFYSFGASPANAWDDLYGGTISSTHQFGRPTVTAGSSTPSVTGVGAIATAEAFGTARVQRLLKAIGLATAEAFGTTAARRMLLGQGIATAESFGTTKAMRRLGPTGIASLEAFGTPRFPRVYPVGIVTAEAFGLPAIRRMLLAIGVTSAESFGTTTARRRLGPTGLSSSEAFGTTKSVRWLGPGGVASTEAFGTTKAMRRLGPAGVASAEAFGIAQLQAVLTLQALYPAGITSAEAFGSPAVRRLLAAVGISTAEAFGTTKTMRRIGPAGVATGEVFGTPAERRLLAALGVSTAEAFGVVKAMRRLGPTGVSSAEAWGAVKAQRLLLSVAVPTAEAFGTAQKVQRIVRPVGIVSAEAFGNLTILRVYAQGITSAEAFGTPAVRRMLAQVGIVTAEAFGTARVTSIYRITGVGAIASAEAFGQDDKLIRRLAAQGVVSGEAFGTDALRRFLLAQGVSSAEAFGLDALRRRLGPTGVVSAEALGVPKAMFTVKPIGTATAEAFGRPSVYSSMFVVTGVGAIQSAEAFGLASIRRYVRPQGLGTGEAFGVPASRFRLGAVGIATQEQFGIPKLIRRLAAQGILTAEAVGQAKLMRILGPAGVTSAEAFGRPSLATYIPPTQTVAGEISLSDVEGTSLSLSDGQLFGVVVGETVIGFVAVTDGSLVDVSLSDLELGQILVSDD